MTATIVCQACGYDKNPSGAEFCDACGSELPTSGSTLTPEPAPFEPAPFESAPFEPAPFESAPVPPPTPVPTPAPVPFGATTARLVAKQANAPTSEFSIDSTSAVVGIFDPDMGPVEVDLEGFQGGETVSRQHAELYYDGGTWKVKDLGSTNGVFIKPANQSRFGARITAPQVLNSGDEIAFAKVRFLFQSP